MPRSMSLKVTPRSRSRWAWSKTRHCHTEQCSQKDSSKYSECHASRPPFVSKQGHSQGHSKVIKITQNLEYMESYLQNISEQSTDAWLLYERSRKICSKNENHQLWFSSSRQKAATQAIFTYTKKRNTHESTKKSHSLFPKKKRTYPDRTSTNSSSLIYRERDNSHSLVACPQITLSG